VPFDGRNVDALWQQVEVDFALKSLLASRRVQAWTHVRGVETVQDTPKYLRLADQRIDTTRLDLIASRLLNYERERIIGVPLGAQDPGLEVS